MLFISDLPTAGKAVSREKVPALKGTPSAAKVKPCEIMRNGLGGGVIGRTMTQPDYAPDDDGRDKRDDWPPTAQPERTQKTPIVFHVIASVLPACYQSTHEAQTKHQTIGSARPQQARRKVGA